MGDMDAREAYFDSLREAPYQPSYDLTREEMGAPETHCPICSEEFDEVDEHGVGSHPYCEAWKEGFEDFREQAIEALRNSKRVGIGWAVEIVEGIR